MASDHIYPDEDRGFGPSTSGLTRRPLVTWALLAANILAWAAAREAGGSDDRQVLLDLGAMFGPLIADGQYWRLFTAIFLHVGLLHLAFNGFGLAIFGSIVEGAYGHARFALIYLVAGLSGSVASYMVNSTAVAAGASGAIFGVLGALAAYFAAQRNVFGETARRSMIGVLILAVLNLAFGFVIPGIDNMAHLGGFAAGLAMGFALAPSYTVVVSAFGASVVRTDSRRLPRRWWIVPIAVAVLAVGAWIATATLPENAYSYYYRAEDHLEAGDYDLAIAEGDRATELDPLMLEAYYVKARAREALGDRGGARAELRQLFRAAQVTGPHRLRAPEDVQRRGRSARQAAEPMTGPHVETVSGYLASDRGRRLGFHSPHLIRASTLALRPKLTVQ